MSTETNRIEKQITLRAPRSRVWKAISNAKEFGSWFGVALEGDFAVNQSTSGKLTIKGYDHLTLRMAIVKIEPERSFAFRWTPHGIDPNADYSKEEPTLVEFTLEEIDGGTRLKVVESGFDHLPLARRAQAFSSNTEGWGLQVKNIEKYLENAGK